MQLCSSFTVVLLLLVSMGIPMGIGYPLLVGMGTLPGCPFLQPIPSLPPPAGRGGACSLPWHVPRSGRSRARPPPPPRWPMSSSGRPVRAADPPCPGRLWPDLRRVPHSSAGAAVAAVACAPSTPSHVSRVLSPTRCPVSRSNDGTLKFSASLID